MNDPERPRCQSSTSGSTTETVNGTAVTWVGSNSANLPTSIQDPIGRGTNLFYNPADPTWIQNEPSQLADVYSPAGNSVHYYYDARGNMTRQVTQAVAGSGLPDIETTAVYPATCAPASRKTCNKPTSVTDARGNTTNYSYDPAHGGVLTETGPAVNGVQPQTRHSYAQRYAWISNGAGGYVQAATPVWVRTETSTCRTSLATGNPASPCAAGTLDEVRTVYDYGPNAGPNNLLLRGQAVIAENGGTLATLRTCYGYDVQGNRISETLPQANLASCP